MMTVKIKYFYWFVNEHICMKNTRVKIFPKIKFSKYYKFKLRM